MIRISIARPGRKEEVIAFDTPMELTVGRSAGTAICLDFDPMVSRMHAVFLIDPPSVRIKDLNSTNGVVINGEVFGGVSSEKILQPRELRNGDEIMIGTTMFRLDMDGEHESSGQTWHDVPDEFRASGDAASSGVREYETVDWQGADDIDKTLAAPPVPLPDVPGYRVRGQIGSGKRGTVYYGVARDGDGMVAIKVINSAAAFSKKMFDGFQDDIEEYKQIQHPHIARMQGAGLGDPGIFVVTDYVNGEDLDSYLRRCPNHRIPLHTAYSLMLQLCSAMCYAHDRGIVHRDLKPRNVILYDDNARVKAKITDLGLDRALEQAGIVPPESGAPGPDDLGYVPPEQLTEYRDPKPPADVFSLAAVFYQMVTGRLPYDFANDKPMEKMSAVASAHIVPIEERMRDLPEPLIVIIDRALSAEPEDRYQNCCDFLEALENVRV